METSNENDKSNAHDHHHHLQWLPSWNNIQRLKTRQTMMHYHCQLMQPEVLPVTGEALGPSFFILRFPPPRETKTYNLSSNRSNAHYIAVRTGIHRRHFQAGLIISVEVHGSGPPPVAGHRTSATSCCPCCSMIDCEDTAMQTLMAFCLFGEGAALKLSPHTSHAVARFAFEESTRFRIDCLA